MTWFRDHYLDPADYADPEASPLFADDLSGLPPASVVIAEFDPLRDEGLAYAERLREAGVPVALHVYDDQTHAFFTFPTAAQRRTRGDRGGRRGPARAGRRSHQRGRLRGAGPSIVTSRCALLPWRPSGAGRTR